MSAENLPVEKSDTETVALEQAQVSAVSSVMQAPLPVGWGFASSAARDNVTKARAMTNLKHGMYSGVPIVCQGTKCPFHKTCWIPDAELEVGARCPIEIGVILERFEKYVAQFNVGDEDTVDHSLIKDLIDTEIMIVRADNSLAISGDFIEEVVAGVDEKGRQITRPELHKAFEAKKILRGERIRILNQMNSTRKDKRFDGTELSDPSSVAANLLNKMKRLQEEGKIVDVTPVSVSTDKE